MSSRNKKLTAGTALGAGVMVVALASTAWACTKIEGVLTVSPLPLLAGQPSAQLGDTVTINYTGGTNLTANYAYSLLIAEAGNDFTCSPAGRAANLSTVTLPNEMAPAALANNGAFTVTRTIPLTAPVGLVQVCAASRAYNEALPPSDADFCNGFSTATRFYDCKQAELTGLPRRGQNSSEFILY